MVERKDEEAFKMIWSKISEVRKGSIRVFVLELESD